MILVFTGDGKGKTSASVGTVIRALGSGWSCCFIQFIKGPWSSGEQNVLESLGVEFHKVGEGFYKILNDNKPEVVHRNAAVKGLELFKEKVNKFDLIVLDEVLVAVSEGLLSEEELIKVLKLNKKHVILTGRGATNKIIGLANYVSEVRKVKHPFDSGVLALKGLDY